MKSLLIFFIFTIINLSSAYKWPKTEIPNPFSAPPPFCNLKERSPFCDPDLQLDVTQVNYVVDQQKKFTQLYKCPCNSECKEGESGLVIGFVLVKEYDHPNSPKAPLYEGANPSALQDYANHIRNVWNLGACDNSVLIAIASSSKQYGLSFGEKATKVLNETWLTGIMEENFRDTNSFNVFNKIKDILFMYKQAIKEELEKMNIDENADPHSLTESNNNSIWYILLIVLLVIVVTVVLGLIAVVVLRHRKENDDVSIKDVWTKKFWLKSGTQYKAAKQNEANVNDKDLEKNEDEEVKAKLASQEDLKPVDDIENVDEIQYPKLSKV